MICPRCQSFLHRSHHTQLDNKEVFSEVCDCGLHRFVWEDGTLLSPDEQLKMAKQGGENA